MKPLREIVKNPSGWDSMENYAGDVPASHWLCLLTKTRDADILEECNFEEALKLLGGESDTVQVFQFGHWACGWWQALCVKALSKEAAKALEIEKRLADYPVVNEAAYSEKQQEQEQEQDSAAVDSFIDDFCSGLGIEWHRLHDHNKDRLWDAAADNCEDGRVNEDGFYRALKLGQTKFPKLDYAAWDQRIGQGRLALA